MPEGQFTDALVRYKCNDNQSENDRISKYFPIEVPPNTDEQNGAMPVVTPILHAAVTEDDNPQALLVRVKNEVNR